MKVVGVDEVVGVFEKKVLQSEAGAQPYLVCTGGVTVSQAQQQHKLIHYLHGSAVEMHRSPLDHLPLCSCFAVTCRALCRFCEDPMRPAALQDNLPLMYVKLLFDCVKSSM